MSNQPDSSTHSASGENDSKTDVTELEPSTGALTDITNGHAIDDLIKSRREAVQRLVQTMAKTQEDHKSHSSYEKHKSYEKFTEASA
jgi:hypothetical protein